MLRISQTLASSSVARGFGMLMLSKGQLSLNVVLQDPGILELLLKDRV